MAGLPREHVVQVRAELSNAVVVRPGDKLVVGLSERLDMATADTIKQRLAERLPGVDAVLIDMCTSLAVYRADARERPDDDWVDDQTAARKILEEYDNPPKGGAVVPRLWVEENRAAVERMAGL